MKKLLAILALMLVIMAFAAPVMAQSYGGRMAQPYGGYQGGQQYGQQYGQQQPQQQMPPAQADQGGQGGMKESKKDAIDTAAGMPDLSVFVAAAKASGYDQKLKSQGPFMVFAPTNEALQRDASINDSASIANDPDMAKNLVENCIVADVKEPAEGSNEMTMTTLGGKILTATKSDSGITVNDVKVLYPIKVTNGIVAVTDGIVSS